MARPVSAVAVSDAMDQQTSQDDEALLKSMKDVHEEKEIVIKQTDLTFIQTQCALTRNEAIELIKKANGDIKEALRLYIKQ